MTSPMRFVRLLGAELMNDSRWMELCLADRGAWISLAIAASMTGGSIGDRRTAELMLRREGATEPGALFDRLLAGAMIAVEGGAVEFPVGVDWIARSPSAEPEEVRERVRRHRRNGRSNDPASLPIVTETTRGEERKKKEEETTDAVSAATSRPPNGAVDREATEAELRALLADPGAAEVAKHVARRGLTRMGLSE
jgi:hypothetical protein